MMMKVTYLTNRVERWEELGSLRAFREPLCETRLAYLQNSHSVENIGPLAYQAIVAAVTELILIGRVKQTKNERKTC